MWHPPIRSRFSRRKPHLCILAGQTAVVGSKQIATLRLRNVRQIRLPGIRVKNRSTALIEPLDLLSAQQEDAAQDQLSDTLWMAFGIGKGQRGAPGTAEYLPALDAQVRPEFLYVRHQVPGSIVIQRCVRRALTATSLVEADNAVFLGVEKATLLGLRATAGTAVEKHYWLSVRACHSPQSTVHGRAKLASGPCGKARSEDKAS